MSTYKTKHCYMKSYVSQLFSASEISRLLKNDEVRLVVKNVKYDVYADFAVEHVAYKLNKVIDETEKVSIVELIRKYKATQAKINGCSRLIDVNSIAEEIKGNICKLVDKKSRIKKVNYEQNMVRGMYKNAILDDDSNLQLFNGI